MQADVVRRVIRSIEQPFAVDEVFRRQFYGGRWSLFIGFLLARPEARLPYLPD